MGWERCLKVIMVILDFLVGASRVQTTRNQSVLTDTWLITFFLSFFCDTSTCFLREVNNGTIFNTIPSILHVLSNKDISLKILIIIVVGCPPRNFKLTLTHTLMNCWQEQRFCFLVLIWWLSSNQSSENEAASHRLCLRVNPVEPESPRMASTFPETPLCTLSPPQFVCTNCESTTLSSHHTPIRHQASRSGREQSFQRVQLQSIMA